MSKFLVLELGEDDDVIAAWWEERTQKPITTKAVKRLGRKLAAWVKSWVKTKKRKKKEAGG